MTQFDYIAGFDISSLASVTQAQFMQAINQIAPLSNIGGVITQAATDSAIAIQEGTKNSPDVPNNPRFARYVWLNTYTNPPIPFFYNANTGFWHSTLVSTGSIGTVNTDMLDANAGSTVIRHMFNDSTGNIVANPAEANQLLALDASGQFVIGVDPSTLTTNDINPRQIRLSPTNPVFGVDTIGVAGNVLMVNSSGVQSWNPINLNFGGNADYFTGKLPIAQIAGGAAGTTLQMVGTTVTWAATPAPAGGLPTITTPTDSLKLLRVNLAGNAAEWVSNNSFGTNLFPNGGGATGIEKSKLAWEAANTILRMNSAGNVWEAVLLSGYAQCVSKRILGYTAVLNCSDYPYTIGVSGASGSAVGLGLAIITKYANAIIEVEVDLKFSSSYAGTYPKQYSMSVFGPSSNTNPLACDSEYVSNTGIMAHLHVILRDTLIATPAGTNVTYTVYAGLNHGLPDLSGVTLYLNSSSTTNYLGGKISSSITLREIHQ